MRCVFIHVIKQPSQDWTVKTITSHETQFDVPTAYQCHCTLIPDDNPTWHH